MRNMLKQLLGLNLALLMALSLIPASALEKEELPPQIMVAVEDDNGQVRYHLYDGSGIRYADAASPQQNAPYVLQASPSDQKVTLYASSSDSSFSYPERQEFPLNEVLILPDDLGGKEAFAWIGCENHVIYAAAGSYAFTEAMTLVPVFPEQSPAGLNHQTMEAIVFPEAFGGAVSGGHILYMSNGGMTDGRGIGTFHDYHAASSSDLILQSANTFTHSQAQFKEWNTRPDGSGTAYAAGENVGRGSDFKPEVLYAIWKTVPSPDLQPQVKVYNGAAQEYSLGGGYTIRYQQGGKDVIPKDAGTYDVLISREETESSAAYEAALPGGLSITPAALVITADDKAVLPGAALPTYSYTVSGWQGNDSQLLSEPTLHCAATDTAASAVYEITASGADAGGNYRITYVSGRFAVGSYRLSELRLRDKNGALLTAIPKGTFKVELDVANAAESESALLLFAAYNGDGRLLDLQYAACSVPQIDSRSFSVQFSNASGQIAHVKVFLCRSLTDLLPLCAAAEL